MYPTPRANTKYWPALIDPLWFLEALPHGPVAETGQHRMTCENHKRTLRGSASYDLATSPLGQRTNPLTREGAAREVGASGWVAAVTN